MSSVTLNLTPDLSNATTTVLLSGTTVNGPGRLINAASRSLTLGGCTVNADLDNLGDLVSRTTTSINGSLLMPPGSLLRVEAHGVGFGSRPAYLTVANSFTNRGAIELTSTNAARLASLSVSSGSLVNEAGGELRVLAGAGGGRTLAAELDNRGTVTVAQDLTLSKISAAHVNTGTLTLSGADLTLNQSGTSPSFTNSGILDVGNGSILKINSGAFNYSGGTLTGTGALQLSSVTLNLTPDLSNATTTVLLSGTTVNGPGRLINAASRSLTLGGCTVNADLDNLGDLVSRTTTSINGSLLMPPGSLLRVEAHGVGFGSRPAYLTVANSFTNRGAIELTSTNAARLASLSVSSGSLVNEAGGELRVLAGAGGGRTLAAELDNRGTVTVAQDLTLSKISAAHVNTGTLTLSGAALTLSQSGTSPSFTNSGILDVGNGCIFNVTGGIILNGAQGTLKGMGTLDVASTGVAFANNGTVVPGSSPGLLSLTGDYSQGASGVLDVELGGVVPGSGHDQFAISGDAELRGTLKAALTNSFIPRQYDAFVIAQFASRTGTFSSVSLPLTNLLGWAVGYTNTNVTLTVMNTVPAFDSVGEQSVDEETTLNVAVTATDTDVPAQALVYALVDPPTGATINTNTGLFSWTPAEAQGPGTNTIIVRVVDDGTPGLEATNHFEVIVNEVNVAPVFDQTPTNVAIDELTRLTVTNAVGDADIPANGLSYQLVAAPAGASIDTNGVFAWIPAEDQGPGSNIITTVVTDDGVPPLSITNAFEVIVSEVNVAPTLDPIPDRTIHALGVLELTVRAADTDIPANMLSYGLVEGPPGATVDPTTGIFSWTPPLERAGTTNTIKVHVEDHGLPAISDTNGFSLVVAAPLVFTSVDRTASGSLLVTWTCVSGTTYRLAYSDAIGEGAWTNMGADVSAEGTLAAGEDHSVTNSTQRFYKVRQLP